MPHLIETLRANGRHNEVKKRFECAGKGSDGEQPYNTSKALSSLSGPKKSPTSESGPLVHPRDKELPPESAVTLESSLRASSED